MIIQRLYSDDRMTIDEDDGERVAVRMMMMMMK